MLKLKKRNIIGSIVLGVGLGSVVVGTSDSNVIRVIIGLLLIVTGISVLLARTDREAGRHTREIFQKFTTGQSSTSLSREDSQP